MTATASNTAMAKRSAAASSARGAPPRRRSFSSRIPVYARRKWRESLLLACVFVHLGDVVPVDEVLPERLQVVGPPVAIIDVIGMLPHVATEDRLAPVHQRVLAVGCLHHDDLAVLDGE